jgi:hypothetical protein
MDMGKRMYEEHFDNGPGGWWECAAGGGGMKPLLCQDSAVTSRSPWTVDFNHAPPGKGYLHLPFVLMTRPKDRYRADRLDPVAGSNRFINDEYPRDFTNARFTVRLRGDLDAKDAQLVLLVQTHVAAKDVITNHVLVDQPLRITPEWSEQTLHLFPDDSQWLCLGTRGDGADSSKYGCGPIAESLREVNVDLILVLFPLDVEPAGSIQGDKHQLRAGKDYPVEQSRLPSGWICLDMVRIEFQQEHSP